MAQRTTNTQLQYGDKCFDVGRMLKKGIKGISTLKMDGGRGEGAVLVRLPESEDVQREDRCMRVEAHMEGALL